MFYTSDFEAHTTLSPQQNALIYYTVYYYETCTIHMTSTHIKISLTSNFKSKCTISWTMLYVIDDVVIRHYDALCYIRV